MKTALKALSFGSRALLVVIPAIFVLSLSGCGSSSEMHSGATANAEDIVGTWRYEVVGIDVLDLRSGQLTFVLDQNLLSGAVQADNRYIAPMRNIRYRGGEVTFTAQVVPGRSAGVAFALEVTGEKMTGIAYVTANSQSVETGARPGASTSTVDITARRVQ